MRIFLTCYNLLTNVIMKFLFVNEISKSVGKIYNKFGFINKFNLIGKWLIERFCI